MGERHAFRAKWHDYNDGIYFVTICSHEKKHIFGKIANGTMHMNELGEVVANCLKDIAFHNSDIEILNSVVMPNHVHMIISIAPPPSAALVRARYIAPLPAPTNPAANSASVTPNLGCLKPPMHGGPVDDFHHNSRLAQVVGSFKAAVTREYRRLMRVRCIAPLPQIWQRLYHDHIIRDQHALDNIMEYISQNVVRWRCDLFNS